MLAPYTDKDWAIWTGTPANQGRLPRVDIWFELHSLAFLISERNKSWAPIYLEFLRKLPTVYMQECNTVVSNALRFPKDHLLTEHGASVFTSSAAWMLAFAMLAQPKEIGLYGLDMAAGSEWEYERPGFQVLVQVARNRGIKVIVPPQSDIDAPMPLYGYGDSSPIAIKMTEHAYELRARIAAFDQRIAAIDHERAQIVINRAHLTGALENNINIRRAWFAWSGPDDAG